MVEAQVESAPSSPQSLSSVVGRIAAVIGSEDFPTGDRARLRRLAPGESPPLAFYRFAFRHLPEGWDRNQPAWITLVSGLALMSPRPHQPGRHAGQVLAESGYSEMRLERLLAADYATLYTLLLRAVRFLAAKGEKCDWLDLSPLLFSRESSKREEARLRIARDFYRTVNSAKRP